MPVRARMSRAMVMPLPMLAGRLERGRDVIDQHARNVKRTDDDRLVESTGLSVEIVRRLLSEHEAQPRAGRLSKCSIAARGGEIR